MSTVTRYRWVRMLTPDSRRTLVRVVIGLLAGIALGFIATVALRPSQPAAPLSHDAPVAAAAKATASAAGETRWLKGQLHAHSGNSGDSKTAPADVLRWYSEHGFDFVVFTDQNHLTALPSNDTTLAIPGVALTLNQEECSSAPGKDMPCLFHVNALPTSEAPWDLALTQGVRSFATATDDAHHDFDADAVRAKGEAAFEGTRGFVMVRAQKDPESIRSALERGQFYASSGVVLSQVEEKNGVLRVAVDPSSEGEHYFAFIGKNGDLLGDRRGREAGFALEQVEGGGYVRAVVTGPNGKKAWTQPVFLP